MSLCEMALAVGLTLGGACVPQAAKDTPRDLPQEDTGAYAFTVKKPEPEPLPEPEPEPAPVMTWPEVKVVRAPAPPPEVREVVKEKIVYVDRPVPVEPPVDPVRANLEAQFAQRRYVQPQLIQHPLAFPAIQTAAYTPVDNTVRAPLEPASTVAPPVLALPPAPAAPAAPAKIDVPDEAYAEVESYQHDGRISTRAVDNSRILTQDRVITGILENGVNSQVSENGGTAIVQVSRNVFGYHGRNILIPRGSRMVCNYGSTKKQGETRIFFRCNRILLGESRAEIYQLETSLQDVQGYEGVAGEVDNRWWERYGSAVLTVGIGAAVETAVSVTSEFSPGNYDTYKEAPAGISENVGQLSAAFLEDKVDLTPIVRLAQGTRVQIRPEFDWYLKEGE